MNQFYVIDYNDEIFGVDQYYVNVFTRMASINSTSPPPEVIDRILATIYGQCIGDAIGILSEFLTRVEANKIYGDVTEALEYSHKSLNDDLHRVRWKEGDWTDDSDQMVLIMRSLVDMNGKADRDDYAKKLHHWVNYGFRELGDYAGLGQGTTTTKVVSHPKYLEDPYGAAEQVWLEDGKKIAPNGGVMRTSFVGVHMFWDLDTVKQNALEFVKTSHFDPRCQASAVAVSIAIATMLQGKHFDTNGEFNIKNMIKDCYEIASECLETSKQKSELKKYMKCTDLKEMKLDEEGKIGYTYKSMGSGFWALKQNNFRQAITEVMLQGGDADTNSCVAGALLGCKLGFSALPETWVTKLKHKGWLDNEIKKYFDFMKWETSHRLFDETQSKQQTS